VTIGRKSRQCGTQRSGENSDVKKSGAQKVASHIGIDDQKVAFKKKGLHQQKSDPRTSIAIIASHSLERE
tara:strand:- start:496 stop:705 length:210 start_codon:yes stop_codon:yes gene_type:complete